MGCVYASVGLLMALMVLGKPLPVGAVDAYMYARWKWSSAATGVFPQLTRRSGCQGSGNAFRLGSADGSSPPWTGGNGTVVQCGGMLAFGLRSRSIRSLCEFKGVNDGALWPASADSGGAGTTAMRGRGVLDGCQREGCCGPKCQSEVGAQGSL